MHIGKATIGKNSLFVFFSLIIRLVTNFLIFIGIARLYGIETLGQFAIAFTVANMCLVVADFGFSILMTTEVSRNRENASEIIKKYFSLKIVFIGISVVLMILIPSFGSFSETSRILIFALTLYVIFSSFTNFIFAIFRGYEKFDYETNISFINNLLLLFLLFVFGLLKMPLIVLVFLFVIARFVGLILSIYKLSSIIGANILKINFFGWRTIIDNVIIFGIHFLFGNLFFQLDTILLGMWKGDEAVGIYQSAFKIMQLALFIPEIARSAVLPILSRFHIESKDKWELLTRLLFKVLFVVVIPVTIVLFFYADKIIMIIYGEEQFNRAIPVLKIFAFIILIRFISEIFSLMLTTSRRQHILMALAVGATILSFGINYFIIPQYGLIGAALVSLGVNFFVLVGSTLANAKHFFRWVTEARIVIVAIAAFVISLFVWFFSATVIWVPVIIMLYGGIAYYVGFSSTERRTIFSELGIKGI